MGCKFGARYTESGINPAFETVTRIRDNAEVAASAPGVRAIAASHRVGPLRIGDAALVAAVAADHRVAAFDTCARLVDTIKERLPVWKHQFFADGTDEWVNSA
jgi:molybdopterin synthase catalytic subunit